jgi:hypothetical protein
MKPLMPLIPVLAVFYAAMASAADMNGKWPVVTETRR